MDAISLRWEYRYTSHSTINWDQRKTVLCKIRTVWGYIFIVIGTKGFLKSTFSINFWAKSFKSVTIFMKGRLWFDEIMFCFGILSKDFNWLWWKPKSFALNYSKCFQKTSKLTFFNFQILKLRANWVQITVLLQGISVLFEFWASN